MCVLVYQTYKMKQRLELYDQIYAPLKPFIQSHFLKWGHNNSYSLFHSDWIGVDVNVMITSLLFIFTSANISSDSNLTFFCVFKVVTNYSIIFSYIRQNTFFTIIYTKTSLNKLMIRLKAGGRFLSKLSSPLSFVNY